ncbi:Adenine phosphoribosyltransferase [Exophiala mesophila]|uniref:adenine phosphoribosyltransferase n=1 Tax=Exophiala mesophila TaxID=212818 RepID=A0A438N7Y6_EXOME|nr:Adenine phosphoribosyltransferase [Exophiala mesophila]
MTTPSLSDSSHGPSRSEPNAPSTSTQLSSSQTLPELKKRIRAGLKQYPDFPKPGILFEDILPLFASHQLHKDLILAYVLQIQESFGSDNKPDVIVGLDARGFLIGATLALRLGIGFVPVRKPGKLPGKLETAEFQKEYGVDSFAIQSDAIKPGQKVLVVDDLIATGGSAQAAGTLVQKSGGILLGYIFIIELTFLKGRDKLNAPVHTLIESQD